MGKTEYDRFASDPELTDNDVERRLPIPAIVGASARAFMKEFLELHTMLPFPFRRSLSAAFGAANVSVATKAEF